MKCTFCNHNSFHKTITVFSSIRKKNVEYTSCKKCNSIHQVSLPNLTEIKEYYESYSDIKKQMNPGYLMTSQKKSFFNERDKTLWEIGFNKQLLKNTVNVELGCANGFFLEYLKKNGAKNIIGIDISESLIKSITIPGVKTFAGSLSALNEKSIDNLFLFNILEHIADIENIMTIIKTRLKNNGKLLLEVPLAGFISQSFKNKWRFLMPDEHLHIPSLKGLRLLLQKYSFTIIGTTRFGSGFTTGMTHPIIKKTLDMTAKKLSYGDRGTFLITHT